MSESAIRSDVRDFVDPGSMTPETIVDELSDKYWRRDVKLEVVDMIDKGDLEEHPQFDGVYRVPDDS